MMNLPEQESSEAVILRAVLRLARQMRRCDPTAKLTGSGLALLAALHRDGAMSAVTLAQGEGLQPQSLSRLLARLERDGLIERPIDAADRRRQLIGLTPNGRAMLGRTMAQRRRWLKAIMTERLDEIEQAQLLVTAGHMLRLAA